MITNETISEKEKPMPENKTRLQALLEVLPNIERDDDGYPWYCIDIYDTDQETQNHYDCSQGCEECKKRFWEEIVFVEHEKDIEWLKNQ